MATGGQCGIYQAEKKRQKKNETEVKVEFIKNMGEHAGIRVVHRSGSKLNFRPPVITNDSKWVLAVVQMMADDISVYCWDVLEKQALC